MSIKLSIIVAVYNQEEYIKQALDSILMQQCTYDYEVIIGEDCSTDNTRKVLQSIENEYPSNFHFIYRKKNYGMQKNFYDLYERMNGEYFIVLEGDDYWTYEYKIQTQIEFLEKNINCIECAHNVSVVDSHSQNINIEYPECKNEYYTLNDYLDGILPGQTASCMYRNFYKSKMINYDIENVNYNAGDRKKAFIAVSNGDVYCFQKKWSAYRYVTSSGNSFSAKRRIGKCEREETLKFYRELIGYAKKTLKKEEATYVAECLYISSIISCIKNNESNIFYLLREFSHLDSKMKIFMHYLQKAFNK